MREDLLRLKNEVSEITGEKYALGSPSPLGVETELASPANSPNNEIPPEYAKMLQELEAKKKIIEQQITENQSKLSEVQKEIELREGKIKELEAELAKLRTQLGITPEEQARISELESKIQELENSVKEKEAQIAPFVDRADQLKKKIEEAKSKVASIEDKLKKAQEIQKRVEQLFTLEGFPKATSKYHYLVFWIDDYYNRGVTTGEHTAKTIRRILSIVDDMRGLGISINGRADRIRKIPLSYRPRTIRKIAREYGVVALVRDMRNTINSVVENLKKDLGYAKEELQNLQFNYSDVTNKLSLVRSDLESTRRLLEDTRNRLVIVQNQIQNAVSLREAQVYDAQKRLELEKRTLETLKSTVDYLLAEIERAKAEAVAIAAKYDEILTKAKEEERAKTAEELREKAEEALQKAQEATAEERVKWEQQLVEHREEAEKAREEAEELARKREELMKRTAQLEAELAKLRAEVEQKKSKLQEMVKETGVKVPVALKVVPDWLLPVIGIGNSRRSCDLLSQKEEKIKWHESSVPTKRLLHSFNWHLFHQRWSLLLLIQKKKAFTRDSGGI